MAVAIEEFVKGLEQSRIISPGKLRAVRDKLPADRRHDAQELARELVRQKILTTYQVKEAYQGKAKELVLGIGYRLPTEAEWEFACRAGSTMRWSFGNTERDLGQHAWFGANSNDRTQRVGELPANPFGLHDLYGNVWEWCWDWHGDYAGSAAGSGRVLRGGAYDCSLASNCRSAGRLDRGPVNRHGDLGFRVCCGR